MKKILIVYLLLMFLVQLKSQTLLVINNEDNEPLELVSITSEFPKALASTDKEGKASLKNFVGAERIKINLIGFKTEVVSFEQLQKQSFILRLKPEALRMSEVVVSATKWSQSRSEVSEKIISISSEDVLIQSPQTTADLLGISGKVFIQKSQQGGGSPMIRGFATNRILYVVDGVRMNTAIFRSGNIQNVISLDPFSIGNTEVLFGANSVIYGSDAIGGVMSFSTLSPKLSFSDELFVTGKANARYSSANNEKTGHFDINLGLKNFALVTSFSSFDFGDLKMGSHGPEEYLRPFYVERINNSDMIITNDNPLIQKPSAYSQINFMQKFLFKYDDALKIIYALHYSETSNYSRYDRHIRYKNGLPRYGVWDYGPQKWMMNNIEFNLLSSNLFYDYSAIRLAIQKFEESRISRNINSVNKEIRKENVEAYSLNADFTKNISNDNKMFYGFELVWNNVRSLGKDIDISTNIVKEGPSRYPNSQWASYATYVSAQFEISKKLSLNGGMRFNIFQLSSNFDTTFYPFPFTKAKISNNKLTGNFGVIFKPDSKLILSTNLATAFRSPNVDDIGKVFDSAPGIVIVPNPNLKAESALSMDFTVTKYFGNSLKFDLSAYYTLLDDALVRRDYKLNGLDSILYDGEISKVQAIQNASSAYVYGIQTGIEFKFLNGFIFSSDWNFQKGEEELDDGSKSPVRHAPPTFGLTKILYTNEKITLQFYAVFSAEKKNSELAEEEKAKTEIYAVNKNGKPYSPSWYTLNLKIRYNLMTNFWISTGIENITDQRYKPYSSGICAPGRNFVLSLQSEF